MPDDFDDLDIHLEESTPGDTPWEPTVVFAEGVWESVQEHAAGDLSNELGGVLLGRSAAHEAGVVAVVEVAVPALHTDASRGRVTFTHDTWAEISQTRDRDYPDLQIVGWYHTHPGFGLFLSEHDLFIQRNFFRDPSQVALVIDPREGTSGFFAWHGDEIMGPFEGTQGAPRDAMQHSRPVAPVPARAEPALGTPKAPKRLAAVIGPWILAGFLGLMLVLQPFLLRMIGPITREGEVSVDVSALHRDIKSVQEQVDSLERALAAPRAEPTDQPPSAATRTYEVKLGDSLWGIAEEIYGNGAKWGALSVYNGVEPEDLEPGMILRVPPVAIQPTGAEPDEQ